ncbi:DNA-binding protein RFX2-like isoform X2 [Macrosteles quadrilineatus]|uniref:DNA-binding protein RFX2-like isoform X2 n=1 Tax=Macrosteles quadrilineatus TaxID=74068 RepID=UPI0023E110A6|nr:DNA-binding protein RFX2-like isoform X2 [Macrosteles quadrilineatus]
MDYDYIKEEYLSDDEYYYEEKRRNLAFQNILDEEEIVRKSLGKVPSRKLVKGGDGGQAVAMATALGANNGAATAASGATITVVATNQILQVTPTVVTVQTREHSPDTISITAVPTSHPTLSQNGSVESVLHSPGDSSDGSNNPVGRDSTPDTAATIVDSSHYITVAVPDTETVGSDGVGHSTYVQYVESTPDQAIYTTTNGQMAYPVYTVGGESGTMYTPASGQYYTPGNSTPVTYTQVANSLNQGAGNQLLGNTTYLIQQSVDNEHTLIAASRNSPQTVTADVAYLVNSSGTTAGPGCRDSGANSSSSSTIDNEGSSNLVHATRISPATVQWLLENYETAEGVSLPRCTMYCHYLRHCYDNKLDPVNAASFGKLIRSVFLGLRTRRLGTRGNSKYHYYGIRVKPNSPLNSATVGDEATSLSSRVSNQSTPGHKRYKLIHKTESNTSNDCITEHNHSSNHSSQSNNHQFLGDGANAIPEFPEIELPPDCTLPEDCSLEDVDTLRSIYREHCEAFLDAIMNLEFVTIESLWREFWRSQDNNNGDECEEEKYLSKTKLYLLSKCSYIQQFVRRVDYHFYQNLVEVLIPDVLRPIPSSLTQAIRNFAKGLESGLNAAMVGCPQDMVNIKVNAVAAFAQTLRRYTSLNHLAQAARAVLQNSTQINQMLADLNRVDFHNVQEQASWVCQCDGMLVQRLEADFKVTLQQQNSLEEWASWLKNVVSTVLKPYQGKPNFTKAARQFLLKWSFYSSMVIRDLTLRSAASFGSFHLIRLLYDEYMFYLIEHQVALATGETPIAVMGECGGSSMLDYPLDSLASCNGDESYLGLEQHLPSAKRIKLS